MTNKIFAYSFKVTDAETGEVRGPVNRYSTPVEAAKHAGKHPAAIVTAEIGLAELAALRAENQKLRAALEKAAKVLAIGFIRGGDEDTRLMLRSTLQHAANECAGALAKEITP